MRKLVFLACFITLPVHATLVNVTGGNSNLVTGPAIIAAPADVNDDAPAATNTGQQGSDEQQSVPLTSNLNVDGGSIAAGTVVDSHMIFLNTDGGTLAEHFNVLWEFSGEILGIMSNGSGSLEVASSALLGASGTLYPATPFSARGLEGNRSWCSLNVNDCYSVSGNLLTLTMRVTEPGDWTRVITKSSVPEPSTLMLFGLSLLGLGMVRRRI